MSLRILVTGSSGLVGTRLIARLRERGIATRGIDLRGDGGARGDVRDPAAVATAIDDCDGIVHLAAVSRVVHAERDPDACWSTNVGGTRVVLATAAASARRPWLVFASSREVYGQAEVLPVVEDARLCPMNTYGRAKVIGEAEAAAARAHGLRTAIVRLSNVYGSIDDHVDRVVPAFARAAARGEPLRVDGAGHVFDFVHVDDATAGLVALCDALARRDTPPPIHLVTGRATTLGELAALAVELAGTSAPITQAPPRSFDVSRFVGDGARARALLGWTPQVRLRDGLRALIDAVSSR